ncbi:hypothetical protein HZH68_015519 [Vespula germanica]|uniref:Uncharacterized protein n=1 Tax=Vespula germanica TaxID=30212 RepID=A0A834J729_VESGE|nr:hypothetical protein HZH68_015519 [Vespula germanica]
MQRNATQRNATRFSTQLSSAQLNSTQLNDSAKPLSGNKSDFKSRWQTRAISRFDDYSHSPQSVPTDLPITVVYLSLSFLLFTTDVITPLSNYLLSLRELDRSQVVTPIHLPSARNHTFAIKTSRELVSSIVRAIVRGCWILCLVGVKGGWVGGGEDEEEVE